MNIDAYWEGQVEETRNGKEKDWVDKKIREIRMTSGKIKASNSTLTTVLKIQKQQTVQGQDSQMERNAWREMRRMNWERKVYKQS